MFLILLVVFIVLLIIFAIVQNHNHKVFFESQGIPYLGHGMLRLIINTLRGVTVHEDVRNQYAKFKADKHKMAGGRDFGTLALMILDPELLKSILVKDFDHFTDRQTFPMAEEDFLLSKMVFTQRGEKWKSLRSKLSPTLTTGKIKRLFPLFDESGKKMAKFVEQEISRNGEEMDLTLIYSKFTMEVIATAVCGMDSQAFASKEPSLFEKMGARLQFSFGIFKIFQLILILMAPKLANLCRLSLLEREVQDFFALAIKSSIHDRQAKNEKRNDFIQLMLEAREGKLKTEENELSSFEKDAIIKEDKSSEESKLSANELMNDDVIAANAVLFILGGYDTTQSVLLFCAYALALNPDVQDKLRAEVDTVLEENDNQFSYDSLNRMTYLEMVINETLRFYPPMMTDRGCTKEYKVPGTEFVLKKGQGIIIPVYGLHHDAEYFPEPDKFDPERFSPENKSKINQYAYVPFGVGPRNCIGMRFALAEVKVAISHLVHNFRIEPSKKIKIPVKFTATNVLKPVGGMFLALRKIQH
ncbi:cytochrome P450 9e2 [Folsomia candida]|uniref:cytochrome P450 9e2 n=1 Tax=Folsomia candida TaxID=158441 RepID=UPI000B8F842A|nr:cytochrome P450 9e2 [Folsomia candida]